MLIFLKLSNSLIFFYQVYPLYTVHWVECVSTKNSVYDNSLTKHCDVCNLPYSGKLWRRFKFGDLANFGQNANIKACRYVIVITWVGGMYWIY